MNERNDMPALDPGAVIQYSAIRYVAGYPESYVKEYALAYAEQRVREEREQWTLIGYTCGDGDCGRIHDEPSTDDEYSAPVYIRRRGQQ